MPLLDPSITSSGLEDKHNSTILLDENVTDLPKVEIPKVSAPFSTEPVTSSPLEPRPPTVMDLLEAEIPNISAPLPTEPVTSSTSKPRPLQVYLRHPRPAKVKPSLELLDPSTASDPQPDQQSIDNSSPDLRQNSQAHKRNPKYLAMTTASWPLLFRQSLNLPNLLSSI
ncbi:hypothetical protein ACH5RR_023205 [Cinchona calisaya]|uniref:Uncharacterized protein n=1 Tax=Cinchona calisaya TaxID=153742 RepID=A0ABD2ZEZ6_9GENT